MNDTSTSKGVKADSFDIIYKRILATINCSTQVELAERLEISQSSISDAKRRESVPSDWLMKLHDKFKLSIDYLRFGTGSIYNSTHDKPNDEGVFERKEDAQERLDSLLNQKTG